MNGSIFSSYMVCKRQAWFVSRNIDFSKDNELMQLGKLIHERNRRKGREIRIEGLCIDTFQGNEGDITILEIKKSSKMSGHHKYQVYFYLWRLEKIGVRAKGVIFYPVEKKRVSVEFTEDIRKDVEKKLEEARKVIGSTEPPRREWKPYCKKCSYYDFCWVE